MAPLIWPPIAAALLALLVVRELAFRRARRRMEQEHTAFADTLKEREALAQVGQLVSGLAQERKSPLQGVIGGRDRPEPPRVHRAGGARPPMARPERRRRGVRRIAIATGRMDDDRLAIDIDEEGAAVPA